MQRYLRKGLPLLRRKEIKYPYTLRHLEKPLKMPRRIKEVFTTQNKKRGLLNTLITLKKKIEIKLQTISRSSKKKKTYKE